MYNKLLALSLIIAMVIFASCGGPKERKKMSELDTPEYHYNQGKKYLERNDLKTAANEFELAKSLKNDFAPAYEGLAIVDIENKKMNEAEKKIKKSLSLDGDWVPANVAKGRWYTAKGEYEDAVDELADAVDDVADSD